MRGRRSAPRGPWHVPLSLYPLDPHNWDLFRWLKKNFVDIAHGQS